MKKNENSKILMILSIFSKKQFFSNMIFWFFSSRMVVLKFFFTQNWVKLQKNYVLKQRNWDFYFEIEISTPKNH